MDKDLGTRIIEAIPLSVDLNSFFFFNYDSKANMFFLCLFLFVFISLLRDKGFNCCFTPIHAIVF